MIFFTYFEDIIEKISALAILVSIPKIIFQVVLLIYLSSGEASLSTGETGKHKSTMMIIVYGISFTLYMYMYCTETYQL